MKERIYLDNNATTFLDPKVLKYMTDVLATPYGNPSSVHSFGQEAKALLTKSRRDIAAYLKVKPHEIIFTSGGTEALNMVIRGLFGFDCSGHIITTDLEHSAVLESVQLLEKAGCEVTTLSPGPYGACSAESVQSAIKDDTRLIALMAVNNVTGIKTDIASIAKVAKAADIPFVVDAVALMGKEPFEIPDGVSAVCFSAHKFHGPTGCGMAFVKSSLKLSPHTVGGGQEYKRRSGTENIVGICGMAEAVRLVEKSLPQAGLRMAQLRDRLIQGLSQEIPNLLTNGTGPLVSNTVNLSFPGVDGESLLMNLDLKGICVSHGSACSSGALEPSRVLLNMGLSREVAMNSVRFSLCRFTTEEEIDQAVESIAQIVSRLQKVGAGKL